MVVQEDAFKVTHPEPEVMPGSGLMGATQAWINARTQRWGDAEFRRFDFRRRLFQRRGVCEEVAEQMADRLTVRDQDRDERRVCLECAHWQQSRTCFLGLPTSPMQLVRCRGFEWVTP